LVFDEVICGFGRTGSWFGAQTMGVTPDLMTFAKGVTSGYLPLSGVIVSGEVGETLAGMGDILRTGYTYSGHPTCAAAAVKNIEIIDDEGLVERANHIGSVLAPGLAALVDDGLASSFRGAGALWALDIGRASIPARDKLRDTHGVILRGIGNALAFCPPLVMTDDELGQVLDAVSTVLNSGDV
jgi:putrescine aminotransferase